LKSVFCLFFPKFLAQNTITHLDQIISHWIYETPKLIDEAAIRYELDTKSDNARSQSWGYSIVAAAGADIASDWISNNYTINNFADDFKLVQNYAFLGVYGIGFGFPYLLGLPSEQKSCGKTDFRRTLKEFQLQKGINGLLKRGSSPSEISSIITEFELIANSKLSCFKPEENVESMKALNALKNLVAAMRARVKVEDDTFRRIKRVT